MAPGAHILDLRVIGSDGSGRTSYLIKAIDWLIRYGDFYDVRIANFSLGHPPFESYRKDPLGQAVEKLVESGVVVICSAGNLGKMPGFACWT